MSHYLWRVSTDTGAELEVHDCNSAQGHDVQQVSIGPTGYLWNFPRYRPKGVVGKDRLGF
ncbi:hypothetical protein F443_02280 [Phytophthora nicotianae P1569]|uniref:Uncharacterized protein n=1 Tax=Phytophthora nicotianae P1569 TaxID=1317065 RepID=V9FU46_PHYNI|nr:hypothetical protein F443_02280 [Phytophthora nicotianae P1569]